MELDKLEKKIFSLEWDIKHESWILDRRIKEHQRLEEQIKQSEERLKNFNDELNNLKKKKL